MNELTISLDPHRKTPLYEQIYGFIREEIRGGRIRAGERLPSARALSGYLSVSRSTVDLAYEQLVSEGYLEVDFRRTAGRRSRKKSCWTQMTACSSSGMRRANTAFGRQSAIICTTHAV